MHLIITAMLLLSIPKTQEAELNRQPQLASAPGLTALVFGSGHSIWFAASHDDGVTFSAPRKIADVPVVALGRHRGPRVLISGKTIVVSAVFGKNLAAGPHAHGLPADGDLVVWRSTDEGVTWSNPTIVNDIPGAAREGLHSMAVNSRGDLAAVWLDLRGTGTKLYAADSKDNGATWSKNLLIYESPNGTICQCCDPSIVFTSDKQASILFRNALDGSRDMHLSMWDLAKGSISQPHKVGTGTWKIEACPMDGGGLAYSKGHTVTAWRRDKTVFLADANEPESALGEGKDVALALTPKGAYVAWTGPSGDIELHEPGKKDPLVLAPSGGFANLTALANGDVLAAWEQDGEIKLRVIH